MRAGDARGAGRPRFGRTERLAWADVEGDAVRAWQKAEVGWVELHDTATEGGHDARAARFLCDQDVDVVLRHHIGANDAHMLERMGIAVRVGVGGDARSAVAEVDEVPTGANVR
ncbi:MAG: NifB/NifX family molybdenum-iron cluster-binding protein [Candidatus Limnocylindrales bacterium]